VGIPLHVLQEKHTRIVIRDQRLFSAFVSAEQLEYHQLTVAPDIEFASPLLSDEEVEAGFDGTPLGDIVRRPRPPTYFAVVLGQYALRIGIYQAPSISCRAAWVLRAA